MLKTINRLPLQKERKKLYQEGRVFYTPLFKVVIRNRKEGLSRFGFIVNKKIDNRAVIRNSIKRKMREVARKHITTSPPVDVLIIANKNCVKTPQTDIDKALEKIINQQ